MQSSSRMLSSKLTDSISDLKKGHHKTSSFLPHLTILFIKIRPHKSHLLPHQPHRQQGSKSLQLFVPNREIPYIGKEMSGKQNGRKNDTKRPPLLSQTLENSSQIS